jgi:hypothetical protein
MSVSSWFSEKKVLIFCKGDWCLVVMNSSVRYFMVNSPG